MKSYQKYRPYHPIDFTDRTWPDQKITKAPVWCAVDLRDGNQALENPMDLSEKLEYFKMLTDVGFKEIEIGFPSASETEFEVTRALIEGGLIPDDVAIQVLVQAREHLIRRTFEAIKGAKNVIVHFYNSTSTLQRKVVFKKDMAGIVDIAVEGAKLIYELTQEQTGSGTNIRFEYSPESFSGTEPEFAVQICDRVLEEIHAMPENKLIVNLPNTVELQTPNIFADQVEYFCRNLKNRDSAIISVHPHNDRGTGVACGEMSLMAGAERVEGTLFGIGERTGNLDIVTMALNMHTQGIDCALDFSDLPSLVKTYEKTTGMIVPKRQPYAGKLAFTAFSGSHQDAINKGFEYMRNNKSEVWEIPYIPIDPADVGRQYEPIVRVNSQSGKGGAAFIMNNVFGYALPKKMHPEFGALIQDLCERKGRELTQQEIFAAFKEAYLTERGPIRIGKVRFDEESGGEGEAETTHFAGEVFSGGGKYSLTSVGNGPINAFCNALNQIGLADYDFISYDEHAIGIGSDARAVSYIMIKTPQGKDVFGVGVESNINYSAIKALVCAVNRALG